MEDMFPKEVRILTAPPTVALIASQAIRWDGVREMAKWVKEHRPECLPDDYDPENADDTDDPPELALFPHGGMRDPTKGHGYANQLTDNELLVELAGRKCYDSFGLKAGQRTNAAYMANIMGGVDRTREQIASGILDAHGDHLSPLLEKQIVGALRAERDRVPHASVLYHAKMTFFFGGLSRRVSQELMRNYVGADRDHEGSPSQESTRFTYHYGTFVAPPYVLEDKEALDRFTVSCELGYGCYKAFVEGEIGRYMHEHGCPPKGMDRKRILEASIGVMPWAFETSFIWTTNPGALTKLLVERDNPAADAEFARFAKVLKRVCLDYSPNLFPRFVAEAGQWSST